MTARAPDRARGDDGLTLAEILVSIVIIGVCVVFLLGGSTLIPIASTSHRREAQADVVLRDWAEAVKAKGLVPPDALCQPPDPYSIDSLKATSYLPTDFSIGNFAPFATDIRTWNGVTMPAFAGCDGSTAKMARVHLELISTDPTRVVSQSLEVVVVAP